MNYILLILCYLLGAIPFGLLMGFVFARVDIRQHGSHNIGATNVLRVVGKFPALLTLLADSGKGALAVYACNLFGLDPYTAFVGGILAVLGHCYSPFLQFKGGKGVATTLGVIIITNWQLGLIGVAVWLLVFGFTRYSSLSALCSFILMPIIAIFNPDFYNNQSEILVGMVILAWFVVARHRDNIKRLRTGQESRFTFKKNRQNEKMGEKHE